MDENDRHSEPRAPIAASPMDSIRRDSADTFRRAAIWLGVAALLFLTWKLAPALLVLVAGLIFGVGLDGASRLIGRVLPLPHGARLAIVCLLVATFVVAASIWIGASLAAQTQELHHTLIAQLTRLKDWAAGLGVDLSQISFEDLAAGGASGSVQLREILGGAFGMFTALVLIAVVGIYVAAEPNLYTRGLAWLTPREHREGTRRLAAETAHVMRRWLAGRLVVMTIDGVLTGVGLAIVGIPLAGLLGLFAFMLAFIPNIGAAILGVVMMLVGFAMGPQAALGSFVVYVLVQLVESNLLTPLIERRAVDLAPAVVLAVQLLFGSLFGVLGIALADPIVAVAKVALEQRSRNAESRAAV